MKGSQKLELNNSSFIFDEPTKPKLSTRLFVSSAKINLNRYWNKLESLMAVTSIIKKNKKKLRKLKTVNQQLLNNRIFPVKQQEVQPTSNDEIYGFTTAKFPIPHEMATSEKSAYKPYIDDSLYCGVNLNVVEIPTLMTTETTKIPENSTIVIDKGYDNYNFYLNEYHQQQQQQLMAPKIHHNNDNVLYIQQLNESLRRKGYKFTLAEIERCTMSNTFFKGQCHQDEGYLVNQQVSDCFH